MPNIFALLAIVIFLPLSLNAEPAVTNSAKGNLWFTIENAPVSEIVELYSSSAGLSSVASYRNAASIRLVTKDPVTVAELKKLVETELAKKGYVTKTVGKCFVCVSKAQNWTLKQLPEWPQESKEERADIFYNFTSTPVAQVFAEYSNLIGRKAEPSKNAFGFVNVRAKGLTKAEAKVVLEIAFAVEGLKPELVGDTSARLLRLKPN